MVPSVDRPVVDLAASNEKTQRRERSRIGVSTTWLVCRFLILGPMQAPEIRLQLAIWFSSSPSRSMHRVFHSNAASSLRLGSDPFYSEGSNLWSCCLLSYADSVTALGVLQHYTPQPSIGREFGEAHKDQVPNDFYFSRIHRPILLVSIY